MKDLRKIIALFLLIFVTGTIVTLVSINNKLEEPRKEEIQKSKNTSKDSTKVSRQFAV